jgi:hypothetical protein
VNIRRHRIRLQAGGTSVALAVLLVACGSSNSASTTPGQDGASSPVSAPAGSAAPPGPGGNGVDLSKMQSCLKAAGISLPTPTGAPGTPPGGTPGTRPSGAPRTPPGGGAGGPGGLFSDPKVQAALKACGLNVPTMTGRPPATTG